MRIFTKKKTASIEYLANVAVAVADPDVLQVMGVEAEGRRGAGELEPGPGLADGNQGQEVRRGRGSSVVCK